MYKVKDNAEAQLQFGISSVATTLVVKEGQGAKFPEVPFLVVLNKRNSDGEITKSEKVEVSAVNRDQFTISRGYEGTTPSDFSADDFVSLFVLAKHIEELQTEVVKKANQTEVESIAQRTDSLEEKLSTAEGQITQLVEAGTPSYLGITGIVGEKYTMEDTLFLQKTPTLADSAIAINVGDIDKNKEIHIQRIGSGTASNQLKLKMKKFGAPTTSVVVEVRKGIKVDVSNKEAYRYGGEVVASTTIAYTEFTTEWKEFTLTLNNKFGATKGELLDIVVYQQGGIVNGTNYYQIACDSTQYSEAFSAVAVNGNSRVRSRLMPYCESDGFLDNCLVKEKKTTYELGKKTLYTRTSNSGRLTFTNGYEEHTVQNVQVSSSANLIVAEGSVRAEVCSLYFGDKEKLIIKPNDNGTIRYQYNISPGSYRIFGNSNRYGQSESMMLNNFVVNEYTAIIYPKPIITHPPRRREEIGGETEITIFGFHIENKWVHRTLTTQTAQTGSIPLGNAVGYKTDYLSDGTEILIPYYNKPG